MKWSDVPYIIEVRNIGNPGEIIVGRALDYDTACSSAQGISQWTFRDKLVTVRNANRHREGVGSIEAGYRRGASITTPALAALLIGARR